MRKALLAVLFSMAIPACSSGGSQGAPTATIGPVRGAEGVEEAAGVDRILAGLDGVMGDLQRILVKERRITTEVTDRLRSIYTGPELLIQIDAFRADVANGLVGYRNPPGDRVTTVSRLVTVSPICVFVEVSRDYGPIAEGPPPPPSSLYVVLVTKFETDDPRQLNPTPWAMLYDGVQADGSEPEDICR